MSMCLHIFVTADIAFSVALVLGTSSRAWGDWMASVSSGRASGGEEEEVLRGWRTGGGKRWGERMEGEEGEGGRGGMRGWRREEEVG